MQMVVVMLPPLCYWWCTLQDRYYSWSCIMSEYCNYSSKEQTWRFLWVETTMAVSLV